MKIAKILTLTIVSALLFLSGCQAGKNTITVIGTWGGSELETFKKMAEGSGYKIRFETTRDLDAVLAARGKAGNLPDIGILPNPSKLKELASQGLIQSIDYLDHGKLEKKYSPVWIDLGSFGGFLYGVFIKAANKSVIWYSPKEFRKYGWSVPRSWNDLVALTDRIRRSGKTPWAIGADIGWPLSDWIENIVVRTSGPEFYEKWIRHEVPWNHSRIRKAFETWGEITLNSNNLAGGIDGTLADSFQNAGFSVFLAEPKAYLTYAGDFMGGIVRSQLTNLVSGEDIDFFPFPPVKESVTNPVVGGADVVVAFRDRPEVRKFLEWLTSEKANTIAAQNGFVTPHKLVPSGAYSDPLNLKSAMMLRNAEVFVFDASDLMPPAVGNQGGFWDACKRYLQNPDSLDDILLQMEKLARQSD